MASFKSFELIATNNPNASQYSDPMLHFLFAWASHHCLTPTAGPMRIKVC